MSLKIVIFGASGMVGKGVLLECLDDAGVDHVLVVGRSPCGVQHAKLTELLHSDFLDYSRLEASFADAAACFFCLGVSAFGMKEADYRRVTHDFTLAAAEALRRVSPAATFIYVSGAGTDSSGAGRLMWARVKGETENALLNMFSKAYMFRPGIIEARRGVTAKTTGTRVLYAVLGPVLIPVLKTLGPNSITSTDRIGRAMLAVARDGYERRILENADINALAAAIA